ncbi:MAG: nitrate- and nitrite sensing domain-containing protein, partial [Gammaproteobacteria bacterium]|nr:nitrate- and nitrite sensing domain-containing protein [Gammaproteobacteria bacterium]
MFNSIHSRLLVLAGMPLIVATLILLVIIWNKTQIVREMNTLEPLSQLDVEIGKLIHETQIERGISVVFTHTEGRKYAEQIKVQRKKVDSRVLFLKNQFKNIRIRLYGKKFNTNLNEAMSLLFEINSFRAQVDRFSLSHTQIINFYSKLNNTWLNLILLSAIEASNTETGVLRATYLNLLRGKEMVGLERAMLVKVFENDQFSADEYGRLRELLAIQKVHFNQFQTLATPDQFAAYQKIESNPAVIEAQRLRDIALSKGKPTIKTKLLSQIYEGNGYGGTIHHFKNLVLRNDIKYKKSFDNSYLQVINA